MASPTRRPPSTTRWPAARRTGRPTPSWPRSPASWSAASATTSPSTGPVTRTPRPRSARVSSGCCARSATARRPRPTAAEAATTHPMRRRRWSSSRRACCTATGPTRPIRCASPSTSSSPETTPSVRVVRTPKTCLGRPASVPPRQNRLRPVLPPARVLSRLMTWPMHARHLHPAGLRTAPRCQVRLGSDRGRPHGPARHDRNPWQAGTGAPDRGGCR